MIELTEEQRAWIERLRGKSPCYLSARAGTGKTSTILAGLETLAGEGLGGDALLLAFNKKNQEDLKQVLAQAGVQGPTVNTLHGLGFRALRDYSRSIDLDTEKNYEFLCKWKWGKGERVGFRDTWNLVGVAKNMGIGILLPDQEASWKELRESFGLWDASLDAAQACFAFSIQEAKSGRIDFDDMTYLPVLWGLGLPPKPLVVVDEAQDLSPLNLKMLARCPGKKFYVGDPFQAIYQFRGAQGGGFGLEELPLTICWRCDEAIIQAAQAFVPDIQARPGAPLGAVDVVEHWVDWASEQPGVILARTNGNLIKIALELWRAGRPVQILGREFAGQLVKIAEKLRGDGAELEASVQAWADKMFFKYPQRSTEIKSLGTILLSFCREFRKKEQVLAQIPRFFSDKPLPGSWVLSTIHKAKGAEWDSVWLLDWEQEHGDEAWSGEVWRNLHYIACTRAKHFLRIVPQQWWDDSRDGGLASGSKAVFDWTSFGEEEAGAGSQDSKAKLIHR